MTMGGASKCRAHACDEDAISECSWRSSRTSADGAREFTGETCGLGLCAAHTRYAGSIADRPLCPWHARRATQMLASSPAGGDAA